MMSRRSFFTSPLEGEVDRHSLAGEMKVVSLGHCITLLLTLFLALPLEARQGINFIRDAEIETTLRQDFCAPILKAANINDKSFNLFIIQDKDINAFVTGGQNLFLHTGTLQKVSNPNELQGVIAHELGHIAGGHLSKLDQELGRARALSIAGVALGAALGAMSKDFGVMAASAQGSMSMAERNLLSFSRGQESSADQAALQFLNKAGISPKGLLTMFKKLHGNVEALIYIHDPYLLTHPMTRERMYFVEHGVEISPAKDAPCTDELCGKLKRLVAKIDGFVEHPNKTLKKYKEGDTSPTARYARALAYHKRADYPKANAMINALITEFPEDPYYHEVKGQMLFEQGKATLAEEPYREAVRLKPDSALMKIALAQSILGAQNPDTQEAKKLLDWALVNEPENSLGWSLMANCHGLNGDIGMAAYSLAEQNYCAGDLQGAMEQITRAERLVKKNPAIQHKLQDMKFEVQRLIAKQRRR